MEEKKMPEQKADEATRKELNLEEIEKVTGGDWGRFWIKETRAERREREMREEILKNPPAMDPFGAAQQAADAIKQAHDKKYGQ